MSHAIDCLGPAAVRGVGGALLMLLFGFAATDAAAQTSTPYQVAQASPPAGPKAGSRQAKQPPADPVEAQISDLQKRLKITPAQQPQFDAFAQAVRQNTQEMNSLMQQEQQKTARNAVEDLRISVLVAQAEADGLKRLLPPLEALYASLSDQQKRTADQLLTNAGPPQQQQQPPRKRQG